MKTRQSSTDTDNASRQPAAERESRDGGSREATGPRSALQVAINRSPRVLAQRQVLETVSDAAGGAPVQRRIVVANKKASVPLKSALGEVEGTPTCAAVQESKYVALVAEAGASSSAMPRFGSEPEAFKAEVTKTHSSAEGIDAYIPVSAADLLCGVRDPGHTIRADGQTEVRRPIMEDTGLRPIFDASGRYDTIKQQVGERIEPLEPPGISGATVLLHELGHALQYFSFLGGPGSESSSSKPLLMGLLPTLAQVDKLEEDIRTHDLKTPRWTARVMELSALGQQLHRLHDLASDAHDKVLPEEIDGLDTLRIHALDIAKLWMEHDVMTGVEHPFAIGRGEGIRLRHGEESDTTSKRVRGEAGRREIEHHSAVGAMDRRGLNQGNAADNMKGQLQVDSSKLQEQVRKLLTGVKALQHNETVLKWLSED
ncbi:hypothetical protein [Roseateles sp. P5_E1]